MDAAPETPEYAREFAIQFSGRVIQANYNLPSLLYAAAKADGIDTEKTHSEDETQFWELPVNRFYNYAEEFGHYLAMQGLGHGVSWFDDHARFPLVVPHTEFYLD